MFAGCGYNEVKSLLFEPFFLGKHVLKNRFVRSATGESRADTEGFIRDALLPMYAALATGGVGLIITGHMYCHREWKCSPLQTGIWDDRHIAGLARLAEACRRDGALAVAQINYQARAPVDMSLKDIGEASDCFAAAAQRALQAGFNGVQIHMAHGYLLSGFLTPSENKRTDEYGAGAEGRRRLAVEIVARVREAIGANALLLCKLGAVDGRDNSLSIGETMDNAAALERAGADALEISSTFPGDYAQPAAKGIDNESKEAYFAPLAHAVKSAVGLPVILVGGLKSLGVMDYVVKSGSCDMVSMCRPFIREPDLVNRLQAGQAKTAVCISCNKCFNPRGTRCIFEPEL